MIRRDLMSCLISAPRSKLVDEITTVSAEQSATALGNEDLFAAAHAIDLDLETYAGTRPGSDGKTWLKLDLGKVNCIRRIIWLSDDGTPSITWTCNSNDCSACTGADCRHNWYLPTASIEKALSHDLPPVADCKYGDSIVLDNFLGSMNVREIAITGKPGEIGYLLLVDPIHSSTEN